MAPVSTEQTGLPSPRRALRPPEPPLPVPPPAPRPSAPAGALGPRLDTGGEAALVGWGSGVVKLVPPLDAAAARALLDQERAALARVDHPGVVRPRGLVETPEGPGLAMDRAPGRRLSALVLDPPLPPAAGLAVVARVAEALAAVHAAGLVHGDLKPANILVDDALQPTLVDFGTARPGGRLGSPGSPGYLAPEHRPDREVPGRPAADVYALGVVLAELLHGEPAAAPGAASPGGPLDHPAAPGDWLRRMTAVDPDDRPHAAAVAAALGTAAAALGPAPDGAAAGWEATADAPADTPATPLAAGARPPGPGLRGSLPAQIGRYPVRAELGRGGMGVVYRVHDRDRGEDVALKVLIEGSLASDHARRRLAREARAAQKLDHRAILPVHSISVSGPWPHFTMPLLQGPSLATRLEAGPLEPAAAAALVAELARALDHAHRAGLVHRDVKPANIHLEADGPVLTDFGLVKELDADTAPLTQGGQVLGTLAWMSPEQARGELHRVGPASDQYALGAVLFACLSGRHPAAVSADPVARMRAIAEGALLDPSRLRPGLPPALKTVCMRMLALRPADRYPDCAQAAADLERAVRGERIAPDSGAWGRRLRAVLARRRRELATGLATGLAVVAVAGALWGGRALWAEHRQARRERAAQSRAAALADQLAALGTDEEGRKRADAAIEAFLAYPEHQGTRARGQVWLAEADRRRRGGAPAAPVREALARAHVAATHPAERGAALLALAGEAWTDRDWDGLGRTLADLAAVGGPAAQGATARLLQAREALGRRALGAVAADPDAPPGAQALARALGPARPLGLSATQASPLVGSAEDAPVVVIFDRPSQRAWRLPLGPGGGAPTPIALPPVPTPPSTIHDVELLARADQPGPAPLLVLRDDARLELHRPGGAVEALPTPAYTRTGLQVLPHPSGAPDRWLVAAGRDLHSLDLSTTPATVSAAHPATQRSNSQLYDLQRGELDGEPGDEILAAMGPWDAYDLRVFQAGPGGAGAPLVLAARQKLGSLAAVTALRGPGGRRLVATTHRHGGFAAAGHFPPDQPHGAAAGIHTFALDGAQLRPVAHQPDIQVDRDFPTIDYQARLRAADLDGDGVDELVEGGEGPLLEIHRWTGDTQLTAVSLRGLVPLAALDADGDGDDELLVREAGGDRALWLLGTGTETLPVLDPAAPAPARAAPPSPVWASAETLLRLGFPALAAETLDGVALVEPDPATARAATLRAAEMLASAGQHRAAAERRAAVAGALAATDPAAAAALHAAAAESFRAAGLPAAEQAQLAAQGAAGPLPAAAARRAAELAALLDPPAVALDLQAPLGPAWSVEGLPTFRRDPLGRGLLVSGPGRGQVLRLPLERTEAAGLTLEGDHALARPEWGGGIELRLVEDDPRPPTAPLINRPSLPEDIAFNGILVHFWSGGGGGRVYGIGRCGPKGDPTVRGALATGAPLQARVALQWDALAAAMHCQLAIGDQSESLPFAPVAPPRPSPPGRRWWLELRPLDLSGGAAVADTVVRSIRMRGVRPVADAPPAPPTGLAAARRHLADGRGEAALDLLQPPAPAASGAARTEAEVLRVLAQIDGGQAGAATRTLVAALQRDPELGGLVGALLRLRPAVATPALREVRATTWPAALAAAWRVPLTQSPDDPELARILLDHAGGLEAVPRGPQDPAVLALAAARARALRRAGRHEAAAAELAAALDRATGTGAGGGPAVAQLWRASARLALARQDPDAAVAALASALAASPTPRLLADELVVDPDFLPLHAHPGWPALAAARAVVP